MNIFRKRVLNCVKSVMAMLAVVLIPRWSLAEQAEELVWDQPRTLKARQFTHTLRKFRDFELSFRLGPESEITVELPRGAKVTLGLGGTEDLEAPEAGHWRIPELPRAKSLAIRLVRIGNVLDVWIDNEKQAGRDSWGNPFQNGGWDQSAKASPIVFIAGPGGAKIEQLVLRELAQTEAAEFLSRRGQSGKIKLPLEEGLFGWGGATTTVEATDGVLRWLPGSPGGVLYWNEVLGDFSVEFMINLPAAANNGVVLRYSGSGKAVQGSMSEIQILGENFAALRKPIEMRQANGAAYGIIAARQGYQHRAGEWNHQRITVRGTHVTVELNGTIIMDGDLLRVSATQILDGVSPSQLKRRSGFFGFAGHGDSVNIKNIYIQKL